MLAIVPKNGCFVDDKLVRSFRKLASLGVVKPGNKPGHADGWGVVAWDEGMPIYLAREPTDAWNDPKYQQVCDRIRESKFHSPLIVHLRKASVGKKTVENTHPFVIDQWAFAHNGTIRKLNLRDKTDSQWFFEALFQERARTGGDLMQAMRKQILSVRGAYDYSSLTFLLSNGQDLFAFRDYADEGDYYTMFYTDTKDAIVICQERFFDSEWSALEKGKLLTVRKGGLEVSNLLA